MCDFDWDSTKVKLKRYTVLMESEIERLLDDIDIQIDSCLYHDFSVLLSGCLERIGVNSEIEIEEVIKHFPVDEINEHLMHTSTNICGHSLGESESEFERFHESTTEAILPVIDGEID